MKQRTAEPHVSTSYPLTAMQHGMIYQHVAGTEDGVNIMQLRCRIREQVDLPALKKTWQFLADRHPALRTRFTTSGGSGTQQEVLNSVELPIYEEDLRQLKAESRDARLEEFIKRDQVRPFDLAEAPLARIALFQLDEAEYEWVFTYHHIILDGRSRALLVEELFTAYDAIRNGTDPDLEAPALFEDHIRIIDDRADTPEARSYWKSLLNGFEAPTPLTVDGIDPNVEKSSTPRKEQLTISAATTDRLKEVAKRHEVTLNTIFQGAWAILLSRYTGHEDVLFGSLRAGRAGTIERAGNVAGMFINNLPVRVNVDPQQELGPWLRESRQQSIDVRPFEHTPLASVQRCSNLPVNVSLFDSILVFDRRKLETNLSAIPGNWDRREFTLHGNFGYPLTLNAWEETPLTMEMMYDASMFSRATIQMILGHMEALFESIASNPDASLGELDLLSEHEREALNSSRETRAKTFVPGSTLHGLFAEQVLKTPDRVAVTSDGKHLTYRELDSLSNRVASQLTAIGVSNRTVGLCTEPSAEMLVGILGILKAGGAYLPLDPEYPADRLSFMLKDAEAPAVIVQSHLKGKITGTSAIALTIGVGEGLEEHLSSQSLPASEPSDPAYVMYTSGSTGRPKGVQVTHHNVVRLFQSTSEQFEFTENDVFALFHSFSFDVSGWEIWGALLHGGRLVVVSNETRRSPHALHDLLVAERVTELNQTPSAFRELVGYDARSERSDELSLRHVVLAGEALDPQILKPWFAKHGDTSPEVINMYGPTEATVYATYRLLTSADTKSGKSMIGRPLSDGIIHILDDRMRPAPVGVPGELYIGGAGVSNGYLNQPELTAQRFIQNPFDSSSKSKLYRSGDLARYMPDGDIEYLGRIDAQFQLRGFRIEPGEIESVLTDHPGIKDAVVIPRHDGQDDHQLVAYLISIDGQPVDEQDLRSSLRKRLPEHMLPSHFVCIQRFPLTVNGKLDRRALPAPSRVRQIPEHKFAAPDTEMEIMLAEIWSDVLRLEDVGINDNFFDLGGHSLLILRVHDQVQDRLKISFQITKVFQYPTIASFAKYLQQGDSENSGQSAMARASKQRETLERFKGMRRRVSTEVSR